jgi:hypothetical protein
MDNKEQKPLTFDAAFLESGQRNGYPKLWLESQKGTMDHEVYQYAAELYASQQIEALKDEIKLNQLVMAKQYKKLEDITQVVRHSPVTNHTVKILDQINKIINGE